MSRRLADFWRRFSAATWARSLEFLRDTSSLSWNLAFPVLLVVGLNYVFSGPGQPQFKVAVLAPPDVVLNGSLHPFLDTQQIQFYREATPEAAVAKVQRQRVDMVLDLRAAPGSYYVNEQSPKGYLLERLLRGSGGAALNRLPASGAETRYVDWVVPGVLGMNMMFSCLFGLGYVIVRYRKSGYLKRLNATPLRALEFILAQIVSRLALVVFVTAAVYWACDLLLHFRMMGSYWTLLLVTVLGAFSMIAMGLLVSARVTNEELAGGILNLITWPMMVISGVFFSLDGAPRPMLIFADLLPLTHMLTAARAIMLDGAGLRDVAFNLLAMTAMSLAYLTAGAALFRWRQD